MAEQHRPISEADLHAFIDGQLDAVRSAEVADYLDKHPEDAERISAYRSQNAALRALFNPITQEAPPVLTRTPGRRIAIMRFAAVLAIALFSGTLGWLLRGFEQEAHPTLLATFPREAAIAHVVYTPDVRHPVEVGAAQESHLTAWLSRRLGTSVHPPHLGGVGYELLGGRLVPGDNGPAAQFMYQDVQGRRLTLYVRTMTRNRETAFRYAREGDVSVFYWVDGPLGYALSGNLGKSELLKVADAVYRELNP